MNMFVHELKQNAKGLAFWCLGMLFLIGASIGKTSGMVNEGGEGLEGMVSLLPKSLQSLFGMGFVDFGAPIAIFAIIALYIALIAAYHACGLGTASFAKEERDRTFEFLYVRGRTRPRILATKVTADLVQILILNAFTYLVSVLITLAVEGKSIAGGFLSMMLGILVLQLVFYALGLFVSLATHRLRTASSISSGIIMALFLLYMMSMVVDSGAWIAAVSPFRYFDGKTIFKDGLSVGASLFWMAAAAAMVWVSFAMHNRRDLHT